MNRFSGLARSSSSQLAGRKGRPMLVAFSVMGVALILTGLSAALLVGCASQARLACSSTPALPPPPPTQAAEAADTLHRVNNRGKRVGGQAVLAE